MLVLAAIALTVLAGFVTLAVALLLLGRPRDAWWAWLSSAPGAGALCLAGAGGLLVTGGLYKMLRIVQAPAEQAEGLARLQILLQEPLEQLVLQVQGADPFEDRRSASFVRLRLRLKSGPEILSEVPRGRLKPLETEGEDTLYAIPWACVVEGATDPEARALAGRFSQVGDFRRVGAFRLEVVQRGPRPGSLPDFLVVGPNDRVAPAIFGSDVAGALPVLQKGEGPGPRALEVCGVALGGGPLGMAPLLALRLHAEESLWVAVCEDRYSPAHRIANLWLWVLLPPAADFGMFFAGALGGGALLLAAGVALLSGRLTATGAVKQ